MEGGGGGSRFPEILRFYHSEQVSCLLVIFTRLQLHSQTPKCVSEYLGTLSNQKLVSMLICRLWFVN